MYTAAASLRFFPVRSERSAAHETLECRADTRGHERGALSCRVDNLLYLAMRQMTLAVCESSVADERARTAIGYRPYAIFM